MASITIVTVFFILTTVVVCNERMTLEIINNSSNKDSSNLKERLVDGALHELHSLDTYNHDQSQDHGQHGSHGQPSGHGDQPGNHNQPSHHNCEKYTAGPDCTDIPKFNCSWCFQETFKFPRCDSYTRLLKKSCEEDFIYNDYYEYQTRVIDLNDPNPIPEVRLQLMFPTVTKAEILRSYDIVVNWTQPPMDIYVLLDVSSSMEDDKANIAGLANQLFALIQTLTNDYRIGLGIFSDRVDAFTYKNVLNLTHEISLFPEAVTNAPIEWGGDNPEDAGTAIYESLLCKEQIGWREGVRKFLLVLTDDIFHTANDGYMDTLNATAIDFDGLCHLDASGVYTEAMTQDYPTIEQIQDLTSEAEVNYIFGIVFGEDFYSNLMPLISPAAYGILSSDSSNLIQLVKTAYGSVVSRVDMVYDPTPEGVSIKLYSKCNGDIERVTSFCEGLPLDGTVTFRVEVTITASICPLRGLEYSVIFFARGLPKRFKTRIQLVC